MNFRESPETGPRAALFACMRVVGMISLIASVGFAPGVASAGRHGDGGASVRDHRSDKSDKSDKSDSKSSGSVRDHRSDDHASVRDHRSDSVRDHRSSGSNGDGGVYVASSDDPVMMSDGGSSGSLSAYTGPTWRLEMGGVARRFRGPSFARSNTVETTSGEIASFDLVSGTPSPADTSTGAFAMRLTLPVSDHFYAGAEIELGGITRSPIRLMTDAMDIHISSRAMIGSGAVAGVRAQHGIAELDAELAGGVRMLSMTVRSRDALEEDPSQSEASIKGVVEARLRGALWVTQHVFLAAQAGAGVLDRGDLNVGLSLGIASRAYGARR
jgi:hypothetical protein